MAPPSSKYRLDPKAKKEMESDLNITLKTKKQSERLARDLKPIIVERETI